MEHKITSHQRFESRKLSDFTEEQILKIASGISGEDYIAKNSIEYIKAEHARCNPLYQAVELYNKL